MCITHLFLSEFYYYSSRWSGDYTKACSGRRVRWNVSCYRSCCLVVLFSPFSASLPTIFPRQKNIKQLMHLQLTGGGRVNSAGCIIYLLLRQGYHSMRQQSPFPPGPNAEAYNHSFSITISLSPPPAAFITAPRYRETLPELPAEEESFCWAGWKQKIHHWPQHQQISGGFCIMTTFTPQDKTARFQWNGCSK